MTLSLSFGGHPAPEPIARRIMALRETVAEQLQPLVDLERDLAARWSARLEVDTLRARAQRGLVPYVARDVLVAAGDLSMPFIAATTAFESAGLASNRDAARAREHASLATRLALSWATGEALLGTVVRTVARRAAAFAARSVLRYASAAVRTEIGASRRETRCPCCGGAADLSFAESNARTLVCARCDAPWPTDASGCLGCGAESPPALARVASPASGYTLVVCNPCGRYLKEKEGAAPPPEELLVDRALTEELDLLAERRALRI